MNYDTTPGSLDGPPAPETKSLGQRVGNFIGGALALLVIVWAVVLLVWSTAWMITHFPS